MPYAPSQASTTITTLGAIQIRRINMLHLVVALTLIGYSVYSK